MPSHRTRSAAKAGADEDHAGDASSAHGLPPGWVGLIAPSGEMYYEDTHRRSTQWVHPLTEPLPQGWRVATTPSGQPYYLNDSTHTTQWVHPCQRQGHAAIMDAPPPPPIPAYEVLSDTGWFRMPDSVNRLIFDNMDQGVTRLPIGSNRVLDLDAMIQFGTDTGRVR